MNCQADLARGKKNRQSDTKRTHKVEVTNRIMLLYELDSPIEHKYGGSLTEEQFSRCTRQTELDSPRWMPYPQRPPVVENICGKFVFRVAGGGSNESSVNDGSVTDSVQSEISDLEEKSSECANYEFETETTCSLSRSGTSWSNHSHSLDPLSLIPRAADHIQARNQFQGSESPDAAAPKATIYTSCLDNTYYRQVSIDQRLSSVCFNTGSPFGKQQDIFHIDGHVTARCTPGLPRSLIFKGSKGVESVSRLMRDLFLDQESTVPLVHMGVISSCIGVRLQTSRCCYLENRVLDGTGAMYGGWMTVEARSPDQCNIIRLSVSDWTGLLLPSVAPTSNDIVITGKGSIVHRFSWTGVPWTYQVENDVLGACESVAAAIMSVC